MEEIDLGIEGVTEAVQIGRGGFAAVYRATQPDFHRQVAVKIIVLPSMDEPARNRFRRECRAIGSLSGHPNIVAVHQSGFTTGGLPYLIMDFVADGSLEDALLRDGPMSWGDAAGIGMKIARTLEFAHRRNLLHRDVKPANILISGFGEPLLADFGVAWAIDAAGQSASALTTGTPAYAPPETWTNNAPTVAGDVYSLGATIHALLTGEPPFVAKGDGNILSVLLQAAQEAPRDLRPLGIPSNLCSAIEWAMAKDPSKRPASAEAFAEALEAALMTPGDPSSTSLDPEPGGRATSPRPEHFLSPGGDETVKPPQPPEAGTVGPAPPDVAPSGLGPGMTPVPPTSEPLPGPSSPDPGVPSSDPSPSLSGRKRLAAALKRRRWVAVPLVAVVVALVAAAILSPGAKKPPEGPAGLRSPKALAVDGSGNVYIADQVNGRVVRVDSTGRFNTFAGTSGRDGGDGAAATAAVLSSPQAVAVDPVGNVFIAAGGVIRKVTPDGVISTVSVHLPGAGSPNSIDVQSVVLDQSGRLVATTGTDVVRIGEDGKVELLAGTGVAGFGGEGQPAVTAKLNNPVGLAFGPSNELYIADSANGRVRKIRADGTIVTVVGPGGGTTGDGGPATDAALSNPVGVAFDAHGDLFIAENGGNRVRRVDADTQVIQTIAGSPDGTSGFDGDGRPPKLALFKSPQAIAIAPSGEIYVIDGDNNRVRRIAADLNSITTVA
jgi:serine/threonine protein kinase/glucose/arabinose dehydrogenase